MRGWEEGWDRGVVVSHVRPPWGCSPSRGGRVPGDRPAPSFVSQWRENGEKVTERTRGRERGRERREVERAVGMAMIGLEYRRSRRRFGPRDVDT